MNLSGQAKKLVIIVGESDKVYQRPLFEAIVFAAKKYSISGATVSRGILSFGAKSIENSNKVFALSNDLPVIIELIDLSQRLVDFASIVNRLMDKAGVGGLMTMENVEILRYGEFHE